MKKIYDYQNKLHHERVYQIEQTLSKKALNEVHFLFDLVNSIFF